MADMAVKIAFIGKNDVSDEINKMRGDMRRFGDTSHSIFRRMKSDALSMRSVMGGVLGARAVTAGIGLIRNQVRTVTDELIQFDHAAVKAAGRYGFDRFSAEFKRIGEAARETGATTRFTAGESAQAIDQFAMAGFRLEDAMQMVKPTAKLAMAADLEIAKSAEIAATALAKFNEPVSNFGKVGDVLAFTANSTKTNLGEMFETIRSGGGIISTVGSDVETFSALARAMGDMKMVGEQAGTSMKTGFLRALVGGKGGAEARKALGLDKFVKDSKGDFKDLIEIIAFMESKYSKMTQADRAKSMRQIFGLNAIEGMNAIFKAGSAKLAQYREEARASTGYVENLSGKMGLSYENKIKEIQSALVEAGFKIIEKYGDEIPGALEKVIETIRGIDFKKIHDYMEKGLALGKQAYETIKAAIPFLKTAAVIWAGFRVTAGIQTAASTFFDISNTIRVIGMTRPFDRANQSATQLNGSLATANTRTSNLISSFGILATTAAVGWQVGTVIHDEVIDPIMEATHKLQTFKKWMDIVKEKPLETRTEAGLKSDVKESLEMVEVEKEGQDFLATVHALTGMGGMAAAGGMGYAPKRGTKQLAEIVDFATAAQNELARRNQESNIEKYGMDNFETTRMDEIESIRREEQSIDLKQKVEVESVIRFDGNVPEGVSAESKVKAPPVSREAMGVN